MQLDLFAPPPPEPPKPDPLAERIIAGGFEANTFLLEMNRSIGGWGSHPNPSRLFQFPIEYIAPSRIGGGKGMAALNHPLIGDHPLVRKVEADLGISIDWEPLDEFGRERGHKWTYFHAVDLMTEKHADLLLESRDFTDAGGVIGGACFALRYGALKVKRVREILQAFAIEEPADRSAAALDAGIIRPDPIWATDSGKPAKTPRFGMNDGFGRAMKFDKCASAWAFLHGIEDGFFAYDRSRHVTMTPAGIERLKVDISPR